MGNLPLEANRPDFIVEIRDDKRPCRRLVCLSLLSEYLTPSNAEAMLDCVLAGAIAKVDGITIRRNPRYGARKH